MATLTKTAAIARAKDAAFRRNTLRSDIDYARTFPVDESLAAEMRGMLEFIIDQSHDTIEEN